MHFFNRTLNNGRYLSYRRLLIAACALSLNVTAFHIVLDPAGDAKHPGRQLTTCCERSVTLQFCELLKEMIKQNHPHCSVTLTRTAGETRTQEQRAQIANQLHADFFLHISCFEDTALRPHIMLCYNLPLSNIPYTPPAYTLIPLCKASDVASTRTQKMVQMLHENLSTQKLYTLLPVCAIPDARLKGIMVPSCTLEFGVCRTVSSWVSLIEIMSTAFDAFLPAFS